MKCPKYIKDLCYKRAIVAAKFTSYDYKIYQWLEEHNIQVEDYDILTGCESIVNPFLSSERIIKAIEETENE